MEHDASALKARLVKTWPVFFSHHGNFTQVQLQAIPAILDRRNTLVIAPTAGGKTEAVIAPLLERLPVGRLAPRNELRILYICPTRALVRDLYERLAPSLERLRVAISMKTGDTGPVPLQSPPTVLLTTPESTDSLLTRGPRLLATLDAVVLDEIHLFDHSPRGDHLRCLLRRIEHIRRYARSQQDGAGFVPIQRIALSATVPDPQGIVARYLVDEAVEEGATPIVQTVQVEGARRLDIELWPMTGLSDLPAILARRSTSRVGVRKSLLFCNTRNEVEQTAAYLRDHLPYAASIFVHYSNLDPDVRRQTEDGFAAASVAICVSSSTLELGIDIGSIDDVVLLGPPPTLTSFLQRIGRGGRRSGITRVLGLVRSPLEEARSQALFELAEFGNVSRAESASEYDPIAAPPAYHFRPSVLVQQVFSILKQSPTGALRPADLRRVAPETVEETALQRILSELAQQNYLRPARLGEWRPGPALEPLLDEHEIYSNIGADPLLLSIVDAFSGRTIAQTNRARVEGETLLLGGRTVEVVWRDRFRIAVRWGDATPADEILRFQTTPFAVPLDVTAAIARHLGLLPGTLYILPLDEGMLLFHFWGDVYGGLLSGLVEQALAGRSYDSDNEVIVTRVNALCLHLSQPLVQRPAWDARQVRRTLQILRPQLESSLELGRFHSLLPPDLAARIVTDLLDVPRFEALVRRADLQPAPPALRDRLFELAA